MSTKTLTLLFLTLAASAALADDFPLPFTRPLVLSSNGTDVKILQFLINRFQNVSINVNGVFGAETLQAVNRFNEFYGLERGVFSAQSAARLLAYMDDHVTYTPGPLPAPLLYQVFIPVHRNRSVEVTGFLLDRFGRELHNFTARLHGQNLPDGTQMNQFTSDGVTPTGISLMDLNSPEDDPKDFGPYPVNRAVRGIKGNAALLESAIRDGILMHTGEWDNWDPSKPMPNSHGCIHIHPTDCKRVAEILVSLGVVIRKNTNGKRPYPYTPQGLLAVIQVD
jgi:hypothetical protein